MIPIAHIENDFPTKFGIPRQSGRVGALKARIVFEPEYRNVDACRGLEEFSHIWLIWEFSEAIRSFCHKISLSSQFHRIILCEA